MMSTMSCRMWSQMRMDTGLKNFALWSLKNAGAVADAFAVACVER